MQGCAWPKADSGLYCSAIVGSKDVCRYCDLRRRHTMVAVTYGTHRIPTAKTAERAKAAAPRKGLFARFMYALVESRLQSVHREISRHAHLLSYTFDERGNRLINTVDKTPFSG